MSYAKLKVEIRKDMCSMGPHGGQRYQVDTYVKDSYTGLVIDSQYRIGHGLTLKEARKRKKEIIRDFYYVPELDGEKGDGMTFGEFVEKVNEIYQGNERDFGKRPVMVSRGGVMCKISDISFDRGAVVMTDGKAYLETVNDNILNELIRMNKLKALEICLRAPAAKQTVDEIMDDMT